MFLIVFLKISLTILFLELHTMFCFTGKKKIKKKTLKIEYLELCKIKILWIFISKYMSQYILPEIIRRFLENSVVFSPRQAQKEEMLNGGG